ncbi:Lysophospholipase L2 [gamma proteobacterium IMCC2047]|nr:Lysophospholipase L2 [gamma proteobacterium IMCC2047]
MSIRQKGLVPWRLFIRTSLIKVFDVIEGLPVSAGPQCV